MRFNSPRTQILHGQGAAADRAVEDGQVVRFGREHAEGTTERRLVQQGNPQMHELAGPHFRCDDVGGQRQHAIVVVDDVVFEDFGLQVHGLGVQLTRRRYKVHGGALGERAPPPVLVRTSPSVLVHFGVSVGLWEI